MQGSLSLKIAGPAELLLERADGTRCSIHPLWLRERCKDAASIDARTQQRLQDPSDFDPDLELLAGSQPSAGIYRVRFSDGHEASLSAEEILAEAALAPNDHDCPDPRRVGGTLCELPRARGRAPLVDGSAVEQSLRAQHGQAFRILSSTPVRFRYIDVDAELTASAPPIELDVTGGLKAIHFSPRLDFVPLFDREQLEAYYRARRLFDQRLRAPDYQIRFLLESGDLVMFDNCRLLHGRSGFDPAEGLRHLQGCYIDMDGPRSLYRVLRRRPSGESSYARRSA